MVANRRVTSGDAGDGSEQKPHVVIGYVDACAGGRGPRGEPDAIGVVSSVEVLAADGVQRRGTLDSGG